MFGLTADLTLLLLLCLLCAAVFEFINGFHDTANAVATVIYTNSLKPNIAVVYSGLLNFIGVLAGGTAVAMGIIKLLPPGVLTDQDLMHNIAMILSLLLSAIIWNLGTWYLGIPASSSHTLIGSILGVGIAYSFIEGTSMAEGVNWHKAGHVGLSLLLSPLIGFIGTLGLVKLAKIFIKNQKIFSEPDKTAAPPWYIRWILIGTCGAVSYVHGSNDGQKGIGLVMLILVAIVPAKFALDHSTSVNEIRTEVTTAISNFENLSVDLSNDKNYTKAIISLGILDSHLSNVESFNHLSSEEIQTLRVAMYDASSAMKKLDEDENLKGVFGDYNLSKASKNIAAPIEYAPLWVAIMIALCLGIGTMIGWKRIVKTIGEKIGKEHLSYAQGAGAEMVAAATIGVATATGLPVSTTQVLSSGIAGSMVASNGLANLQKGTMRNIALAWLLTLPVTMTLAGVLFTILRFTL